LRCKEPHLPPPSIPLPPSSPHVPCPDGQLPDPATDHVPLKSPAIQSERYIWIGNDNTKLYMDSIKKWQEYSNTSSFTEEFDRITREYSRDNEVRS
jgi:hypothetical protein